MRTLCDLTSATPWLDPAELRIGLGCMRLSSDGDRDEALAAQTIAAARDAGITVFDTAHAYGRDETELGSGERLLARALAGRGRAPAGCGRAATRARVITKGGMTRPGGGWVPDGRAKRIMADCEASLAALGGLPIDLYLIHAPDPRTPWPTSVRALARLLDEGMVARVGLSNVSRHQLDQALELVPVSAVEVALSVHDERALRGGIVARCEELSIAVIAHSPLGGPRRAGGLARRAPLAEAARAASATPAEVALAWLLGLSPVLVAIPGARRPETARSAARAARLTLDPQLAATLGSAPQTRRARATTSPDLPGADADVVLIMGVPGAGKSRLAETYRQRGYVRLNRDERGGALQALADELTAQLELGARRVVLDNTYLTRAARSYVIEAAGRHGLAVRCVWLETPLAQAQVNMVERLLERFGGLPSPEDLRALARREPGALAPTQQMRTFRELEPPSSDEGFAAVEVIPFTRAAAAETRTGVVVFVAAAALAEANPHQPLAGVHPEAPHLVFDWRPDGSPADLAPLAARLAARLVETAVCPHGAGPPRCWCRPPLPGLPLAFAHTHGLDPARCMLIGNSTAHRTLAAALGARYVES